VPDFQGNSVTCTADDVLTPEKKTWLMDTIMPAAISFLGKALKVIPPAGNLVIPSSGGQGTTCGLSPGVKIPSTHQSTGLPNTDFVAYISVVPTSGNTLAWATHCRVDQDGRPIAAHVNFGPQHLQPSPKVSVRDNQVQTAIHEVMHALGFAGSHWKAEYLKTTTERGTTVTRMITPSVVMEAKRHFNCSTLEGMEIENNGGSGTAGSHWEKRLLGNEGMTGVSAGDGSAVFSTLTLAMFSDLGFYSVDYGAAGALLYGRGRGCDFATANCKQYNDALVAAGKTSEYCFEQTSNVAVCTFDRRYKGHC